MLIHGGLMKQCIGTRELCVGEMTVQHGTWRCIMQESENTDGICIGFAPPKKQEILTLLRNSARMNGGKKDRPKISCVGRSRVLLLELVLL